MHSYFFICFQVIQSVGFTFLIQRIDIFIHYKYCSTEKNKQENLQLKWMPIQRKYDFYEDIIFELRNLHRAKDSSSQEEEILMGCMIQSLSEHIQKLPS